MNTKTIEQIIVPILTNHNLRLYSIKTKKEYGEDILEILIDETNLTYEILEPIHNEILDAINDLLPDNYLLEIASVGLERPLNNLEEVANAVGSYIYLESDSYQGNATLQSISDSNLEIKYFTKGKPKTLIINYDKIKYIRKAVKV